MNTLKNLWARYWDTRWFVKWPIAVLVGLVVLGALAPSTEEEADADQGGTSVAVTSTAVVAATTTPEPTIAATETPAPAATEACPTPAQQAYFSDILEPWSLLGDSYGAIGQRFIAAGDSPGLLLDSQWNQDVTVALLGLIFGAQGLSEVVAPGGLEELDGVLKDLAAVSESVAYEIEGALADFDSERMDAANAQLAQMGSLVTEANALVEGFCEG